MVGYPTDGTLRVFFKSDDGIVVNDKYFNKVMTVVRDSLDYAEVGKGHYKF